MRFKNMILLFFLLAAFINSSAQISIKDIKSREDAIQFVKSYVSKSLPERFLKKVENDTASEVSWLVEDFLLYS